LGSVKLTSIYEEAEHYGILTVINIDRFCKILAQSNRVKHICSLNQKGNISDYFQAWLRFYEKGVAKLCPSFHAGSGDSLVSPKSYGNLTPIFLETTSRGSFWAISNIQISDLCSIQYLSKMGRTKIPQPDSAAQGPPLPLPDRTQFVTSSAYDPFEIVDLMTDFYELYVKMRYVKRDSLKYPPHSPPINVEQIKSFGFEPQVIAILQLLPYVEGRGSEDNFFGWGGFADFRGDRDLSLRLCDPVYSAPDVGKGFEEENGPYVRPWVLPINQCGNHGCVLFFDTRNGEIFSPSLLPEVWVAWI
jgi:hypothetical protein